MSQKKPQTQNPFDLDRRERNQFGLSNVQILRRHPVLYMDEGDLRRPNAASYAYAGIVYAGNRQPVWRDEIKNFGFSMLLCQEDIMKTIIIYRSRTGFTR